LEASGTWSETFHDNSWTNRYPIVALLLFVELVYLLTLPLGYFLFRGLPDRGLIFARLVGLIAISFIVWSMASFQWMSFSVLSIWISLLAIFGVSSLIMWQCKKDFLAFLKEKWKLLLTAEVLFIIAFLLFVLIRMANPDLWHPFRGGEKPMDLAYLTAVTKSNFMPPYDPWFASGHLNYYYWGFFLMGVLAKATGIIPVIFYNLAIPFLFALTVTGAFSIIYNLTEGARHRVASSKSMMHSECWFSSPVLAGLVGSIFVCVIGNLDGIVQIFQAGWSSVVSGGTLTDFDFWRSSRMIPELTSNSSSMVGSVSPHITEFPYFSFLFADLHPHVIAIPVTLLTIGLTLNTVSMLKSDKYWVVVPSLIALSIVLGSLWAINTWDFPAYALFAVCGIGIGLLFTEKSFRSRVTLFSLSCTLVILVSFMAFLPFHVSYEMFGGFIQRSFWQTPLPSFLLIHGLFLVIICTFMWVIAYPRFREIYRELTLKRFKGYSVSENESKSLVILLAFVTGVAVIAIIYSALTSHWNGALLIAVLYLTIFSGIVTLKDSGTFQRSFVILMICVGILIAIGVDFIRIGDDIGRMNTVFKFYIQVWILFALAAAFGLWYVFHSKFINVNKISLSQLGWLGIVGALILCGLTYTVFGTSDRMRDRFGGMSFTLDGSKYMDTASHVEDGEKFDLRWDKSAIEWLQLNVVGTPVVLEAATNQYRWGSRVSQYTGLPTILGWPWHQIQQRKDYSNDIEVRKNTVSTMYNSPNEVIVLALLLKYRVKYVIVGPLERIRYTSTGLEKFDRMVGRDMELVYENPGVKIFEVIDVPNSDPA
jgi:YYY domain-containing protein